MMRFCMMELLALACLHLHVFFRFIAPRSLLPLIALDFKGNDTVHFIVHKPIIRLGRRMMECSPQQEPLGLMLYLCHPHQAGAVRAC